MVISFIPVIFLLLIIDRSNIPGKIGIAIPIMKYFLCRISNLPNDNCLSGGNDENIDSDRQSDIQSNTNDAEEDNGTNPNDVVDVANLGKPNSDVDVARYMICFSTAIFFGGFHIFRTFNLVLVKRVMKLMMMMMIIT